MVKIVCTTVVETVKMVLGATYQLAGVTMAVKLDLRGGRCDKGMNIQIKSISVVQNDNHV